jgi:type II secretory pathway predicted ATPase ExeA
MLKSLIKGNDLLSLVIGERGSGKTTLLQQLLGSTNTEWRYCKILFHSKKDINKVKALGNLHERMGMLLRVGRPPILIIDDAHEININGLCYLLGHTLISGHARKFRSLMLFCEPPGKGFVEELSECIPIQSVVNKLYIKPLSENQTAQYLHQFVEYSDLPGKRRFSSSQIKKIFHASHGIPGRINQEAQRLHKNAPFWKKARLFKAIIPKTNRS